MIEKVNKEWEQFLVTMPQRFYIFPNICLAAVWGLVFSGVKLRIKNAFAWLGH